MSHNIITRSTALSSCLLLLAMNSQALAADGVITAGSGTITHPVATTTLVTTTTDKAVARWANGIDTAPGETLQFAEPNANSMVLNIVGGGRTNFQGNLVANGKVWIINPDGMLFNGATINVGSLLLSNAGITNPEGNGFFTNNSGHYALNQTGNQTASIVIDHTVIHANGDGTHNGDIIIMAPAVAVQNNSHVSTNTGDVMLQAGETFAMDFDGDGLVNYTANGAIVNAVSQPVTGADASVYVGSGSTIDTQPNDPAHPSTHVFIGADVYKEAVLDHIINIGGMYYDTPPQQSVGILEPGGISPGYIWAVAPVTPKPSVTQTIIAPQATNIIIPPLTRPLRSIGDETVNDTVMDPKVANVSYARPYLVSLATSIDEGKLTLAAAPQVNVNGAADPASLGNLAPSAGGNSVDAQQLADLSPSAGGTVSATAGCANSFLDAAWLSDPESTHCAQ